jgi:CBS domain-containing protein
MMKVKDIMTKDPQTCTRDTTVAAAAHLLWEGDCGILPVIDDGKLVGVVTDRDMYIALATRNARASQLKVGAVATTTVATCAPEDDVHTALATMKRQRVRRLPVVGFGNTVLGVLSMNDIVLAAGAAKPVRSDEVVDTLQAICGHHHPVPHVIAA